ncbi:hypothetical protein BJ742DRAFT_853689 [Cladochytrium replicatum]|nr:hypothetical protein BJ742DRAFT_853689 [Cladochytrium replicatum]
MNTLPHEILAKRNALKKQRVILHVDLDCFYAQVEHRRLDIPHSEPLCVQQWQSLIAVNYAARARGVRRFHTAEEAKKICPEVRLVHVATFVEGEMVPRYREGEEGSLKVSQRTHKVSLESYRNASKEIFGVFKTFSNLDVERAGIDEAYLDVTEEVHRRIFESPNVWPGELDEEGPVSTWSDDLGRLAGETGDEPTTTSRGYPDLAINLAAHLSKEIRAAVLKETKFTCSSGISPNKTVSKLCSPLNKPNGQAVLRSSQVLKFMATVEVTSIRGLGGKFGRSIGTAFESSQPPATMDDHHEPTASETQTSDPPTAPPAPPPLKCGDLWKYSKEELEQRIGDPAAAIWLHNIVRGICNDDLREVSIPKSMMAAKSIPAPFARTRDDVAGWIGILSAELYVRITDEYELRARWPKTMTVHVRSVGSSSDFTRTTPVPPRTPNFSAESLRDKVTELVLGGVSKPSLPSHHITLSVSQFISEERGSAPITRFFAPSVAGQKRDAPHPVSSPPAKRIAGDDFHEPGNHLETENGIDHAGWIVCGECGERVESWTREEHTDFHFAMALYREDQQARALPNIPKPLTKGRGAGARNGNGGSGSKRVAEPQNAITTFFKPGNK